MSISRITPSAAQVNEGDGLTTSIETDLAPGTTLFFKVSGRGISKKDFAAGGVKGSIKVDANGVATISHTLRADKATEGEESFAIQVFSDKKMRNLLGQSDAVTVFDTSVKAGKGGGSGGAKDAVTGLFLELAADSGRIIRFTSDIVFRTRDVFPPSSDEDSVNPTNAEWEFGHKYIAYTGMGTWSKTDPREYVVREVYEGDFAYDSKGRMTSASIKSKVWSEFNWPEGDSSAIHIASQPVIVPDTRSASAFLDALDTVGSVESIEDSRAVRDFGGGRFFNDGWWNAPFTSNLI